jgi:hypothetical protein
MPNEEVVEVDEVVLFETPMRAPPGLTPPLTIRGPRDAVKGDKK